MTQREDNDPTVELSTSQHTRHFDLSNTVDEHDVHRLLYYLASINHHPEVITSSGEHDFPKLKSQSAQTKSTGSRPFSCPLPFPHVGHPTTLKPFFPTNSFEDNTAGHRIERDFARLLSPLPRTLSTMPETEEKPAPEAVADAAEQAVEEIVEDVKEAKEEAKGSAGASLSDALASAKSGLGTLQEWSGAAVSMVGGAWSTVGGWKEQGAGLVRYI